MRITIALFYLAIFFAIISCNKSIEDSCGKIYEETSLTKILAESTQPYINRPKDTFILQKDFSLKNIHWKSSKNDSLVIKLSNVVVYKGSFQLKGKLQIPHFLYNYNEVTTSALIKHKDKIYGFDCFDYTVKLNEKSKNLNLIFGMSTDGWVTIYGKQN